MNHKVFQAAGVVAMVLGLLLALTIGAHGSTEVLLAGLGLVALGLFAWLAQAVDKWANEPDTPKRG